MTKATRCAACKYFRRRCPRDCIFAPYFPNNNPQRFAFVHKIYGASNIGKMLEETPVKLRADTMDALYCEAKCRIEDPVYGCVGIISSLYTQIQLAQSQLAKAQAEIAFLEANNVSSVAELKPITSVHQPLVQQVGFDYGLDVVDPFDNWFYY
uniref:LOB domain-containing protein 24-like n=1 Tax=Erigeron canadensis TaxID=72917 RepID=UPI001CB93DAA|nr:LOB domain-containing protein 24-like [Erigeron canadensis]